jgi:hypothetical protein
VWQFLGDKENYPVNLKFGRPKITTNEKIVLASMFYPLYAFAVQLSPEPVGSLQTYYNFKGAGTFSKCVPSVRF